MKDDMNRRRRVEEERGLKEEGFKLLERSCKLLEEVQGVYEETSKLEDRSVIELLDYDKIEDYYKKVEKLQEKMNEAMNELVSMNVEYEDLRVRVNRFYGKEVMKEYGDVLEGLKMMDESGIDGIGGFTGEDKDENDKNDDDGSIMGRGADWWKG